MSGSVMKSNHPQPDRYPNTIPDKWPINETFGINICINNSDKNGAPDTGNL